MPLVDERERTEAFEAEVGGPERGFALMRLYERCRQAASGNEFRLSGSRESAEDKLRRLAPSEGFSRKAVAMFLGLQD